MCKNIMYFAHMVYVVRTHPIHLVCLRHCSTLLHIGQTNKTVTETAIFSSKCSRNY